MRWVGNGFGEPCIGGDLRDTGIDCVGGQICQIQHSDPATAQPHMNCGFREHELHERLTLGWQLYRDLNHCKLRTASSHLKLDKRNEQITGRSRLVAFRHQRGLIKVRMAAEFLLGELNDVGVSSRELPTLEGVVEEIDSEDFRGDENCLGMVAANDDAGMRKEPFRVDTLPYLSGDCVVGLDE